MALLVALVLALLLAAPAGASTEVVVTLAPGATASDAAQVAAASGGTIVDAIPQLGAYLVRIDGGEGARRVAALGREPRVRSIEPNGVDELTGGPPFRGPDWHLQAVEAEEAWTATTGSATVTIAILDTGVALDRPELAGRVVPGIDVADEDANPADRNGHGTFVAGIAASSVGAFVAGVCPGCSIMPVKVVGDGAADAKKFDSAEGIVWAVDHGADVVNLSFGGPEASSVQADAIEYARRHGVVVVAAAGNEGTAAPQYPAAYEHVVAVGGTDGNDRRWSGSSEGGWVDLGAPADRLLSLSLEGGFERRSGTSFSTPIVSGAAGLILSAEPDLDPSEVEAALRAGTVPLARGQRPFDRGRLDIPLALAKARAPGQPTITILRLALSPLVRNFGEPRAGRTFAAGAVAVRDDSGAPLDGGTVTCIAKIGGRVIAVARQRLRMGTALCAWRVPWSAGERWIEGTLVVTRSGYEATQTFRVKAKKPLRQS